MLLSSYLLSQHHFLVLRRILLRLVCYASVWLLSISELVKFLSCVYIPSVWLAIPDLNSRLVFAILLCS
ncbi:hypothetical protein SLEP1_g14651 [Rubroshorea leprosula]|uniref:Uncharacterized protein n=1 Tax=Rubroshorea leprosula TaxID=152421 RepID=A0AAV5IV90_9ROSI|nr:hypothetical protein SLEP1_g14651 [Rubroshorea leprosula]